MTFISFTEAPVFSKTRIPLRVQQAVGDPSALKTSGNLTALLPFLMALPLRRAVTFAPLPIARITFDQQKRCYGFAVNFGPEEGQHHAR